MLAGGLDNLVIGIILIGVLAAVMHITRVLTLDGIIASAIMGLTILVLSSMLGFITLLLFLIVGSAATFIGKNRKRSLESLDIKDMFGRSAYNVMSNGIVPMVLSSLHLLNMGRDLVNIAYLASISAVLADTLGSEIGVLSRRVYLIINFKRVPPGTNGGVSLLGTGATLLGALIIGIMAIPYGYGVRGVILVMLSGFLGAFVDSLLGATLEARGTLDKGGVNMLCSASAAAIATFLFVIL